MVPSAQTSPRRSAFTLVELLVVIGIIALLISILLPSFAAARRSASNLKCASNLRQLCIALVMYSNEFKGRFPPNIDSGGLPVPDSQGRDWSVWYDYDRIGRYLPKTFYNSGSTSIGGPVFICPEDVDGKRSYTMNYWASSAVIISTGVYGQLKRADGAFFGSNAKNASSLMLIVEAWSKFGPGADNGYYTGSSAGSALNTTTTPGQRFLGIPGYVSGGTRYSIYDTEITYARHRRPKDAPNPNKARGWMNIGFCDGHVELLSHNDLADVNTGLSRLKALWSPLDIANNH